MAGKLNLKKQRRERGKEAIVKDFICRFDLKASKAYDSKSWQLRFVLKLACSIKSWPIYSLLYAWHLNVQSLNNIHSVGAEVPGWNN